LIIATNFDSRFDTIPAVTGSHAARQTDRQTDS